MTAVPQPTRYCALAAGVLWLTACSGHAPAPATPTELNTLTAAERDAGWRLLFDGRTTQGWRGFRMDTMPSGWQAVDGALQIVRGGGPDIVSRDTFTNFELQLEWRIAPGGNSGIFYRGSEDDDAVYWNAPEMQVLDDSGHSDGRLLTTSAGSVFGLYPVPSHLARPAGQWNQVRILVNGHHVEHWLNGVKAAEYEFGSADWDARVRASKFAPHVHFGRNASGFIALQDHGGNDRPAYRNIRIRVLP